MKQSYWAPCTGTAHADTLQLADTIKQCVYQNLFDLKQEKKQTDLYLIPKVTRRKCLQMDVWLQGFHGGPRSAELRESDMRIYSDCCILSVFCLNGTQGTCKRSDAYALKAWRKTAEIKSSNVEDRGNMRTGEIEGKTKILTCRWNLVYSPRASALSADVSRGPIHTPYLLR